MLVLSRFPEETIRIGDDITIKILEVQWHRKGYKVRVGIEAPANIPVHREEVYFAIQRQKATQLFSPTPNP